MVARLNDKAGTAKRTSTAKMTNPFASSRISVTPNNVQTPGTGSGTAVPVFNGGGQIGGGPSADPYSGGSGGGGSYSNDIYSGGGGGSAPAPAPVVTPPTEEDYLAGDSGYQTQLSALQSALQRYIADSDFQRKNYETDYNKSLRDLGYDEGKKAWNWTDQLTASGRGYQNQLNDFGARGMLQSSGYADAFNELQRMLNQQYDSLSGAKTNYMTDLDNQLANYKGENTSSQQAARAEALQRRAAQYGV